MAQQGSISLKAMVDKVNNQIIFAEAKGDFVDVLLSFLTMPMGTMVKLIRSKPPILGLGCMNNLYESVENLDVEQFKTKACKTMLLNPRNAAEAECKRLKLKIDDGEPWTYYICWEQSCTFGCYKLLSYYDDSICKCGRSLDKRIYMYERVRKDNVIGVFVEGATRHIISDELEIIPSSIEASLSLLSKQGVVDGTTVEERNFDIGVHEVLTLLKWSLVSKTPLTETLLKHNPVPDLGKENCSKKQKLSKEDFDQGSYIRSRKEEAASDACGKIHVKLIVNKSKNIVYFEEASEDFIDLLCSFLTVPLGCVVKELCGGTSKGCITHLYNSVEKLDANQHLKSPRHKEMLVSPKLAPSFSYKNNPLGIEEHKHPPYYCYSNQNHSERLTSDEKIFSFRDLHSTLTVVDPKSRLNEATLGGNLCRQTTSKEASVGGYFSRPAKFIVTDNLIITPISPASCLSLLNELKVPFSEVRERIVHVGTEEALQLMVTSFVSESVLTNAFLREPKPEY